MYCRLWGIIMICLLLVLSIGSIAGCSEKSPTIEEQVAEDLKDYLEHIDQQVVEKEKVVTLSYRSVTGENYTDAENMYNELTETTLPEVEILLEKLRDINPKTEEVQQLHKIFVSGWEDQKEAFQLFVEAIEKKDQDLIEQGNLLLEDGAQKIDQFTEKKEQMMKKYDV